MPFHRRSPVALLAAALAATALAGCFSPSAEADEATYQIGRSFVIDVDAEKAQALAEADTPQEYVRALVDASLVVRAGESGSYTLSYTDEDGRAQNRTLSLEPGAAQTVEGVDVFTAATLTRDGAQLAARGPIPEAWWQIGDVPLGVRSAAPAEADYAFSSFASLDLSLADIQSEEGNARLDSLVARLALPVSGSLAWTLAEGGVEDRLDLSASFAIDDSRGALALVDVKGTIENETGEAGVEVLSGGASMEGAFTLFVKDGQITAGQFQGGSVKADPKVIMWATGAAAQDESMPCAGKARADACEPEQLESFSDTEEAGEREDVPEDEFQIEDDQEGRDAVAMLQKLFAQDLALHDSLTVRASFDSEEMGAGDGTRFRASYVHEMTVVAREAVQVAAGSFDAYRIVTTSAVDVQVDEISQERCSEYGQYGCEDTQKQRILDAYGLQETLVRSTLWLDSATYQPLKGTVEAPADVGAILRDLLDSLGDGAWAQAQLEAFDPSKLQLTADSEASFEARKLAGGTRLSPYVGLALGSIMSGSLPGMASPLAGAMPFGGMQHAHPAEMAPERPPSYLSIYSDGPIAEDGSKTLVVAGASPELYWSDIRITVDGEERGFSFAGECAGGYGWEYVACTRDGEPESYRGFVESGDTIRLPEVTEGQELRVLDSYSNSVIFTMTLR